MGVRRPAGLLDGERAGLTEGRVGLSVLGNFWPPTYAWAEGVR